MNFWIKSYSFHRIQLFSSMKIFRYVSLIVFLCTSLVTIGQTQFVGFEPNKGDRIIFLGNTFADRMRHYGYFETLLQKNFPGKELTMRNMGWSADEVGLQPRPLNFPGFKEETGKPVPKEVSFQKYKFEGEKIVMPVALNFAGLNQDLTEQKASFIFLCFGMNEAFKGKDGLAQFNKDLDTFIQNLLANQYNGHSTPKLILVSPIAHENLGGYLPDPDEHNRNLLLYTDAMQKMAAAKGILFIDFFTVSSARMKEKNKGPLTINGIHLTDEGYQEAAKWMARQLNFKPAFISLNFNSENATKLRQVIKMKDDHFFYRWRAVNGEYIYGRRREPFGVLSFPPELKKLNKMAAGLDSVIWKLGKGAGTEDFARAIEITDERGKPVNPGEVPEVKMTGRQGSTSVVGDHSMHETKSWPATTENFTLPKGYEINLFASEKDFLIEKPVAMNFDAKGRLWVATMPTYPQYFPGIPVHDRIVILEDTDGDGKADKHTVFADNLYLPLGFEFFNGGIIVSQEPDLVFLKDTDGDDKADFREVILTGFGSEDSHHATHAFTFGQDGGLYFNEGTFLNSQVETPYGPIRSYSGATYRYEPRTGKLSHYISYPYYNPWGSVFDKWGTHLIGDASDGSNYFAPPMTGKVNYPDKHPRINMFTTTRVRPTAGIEIVSSRQFPDDVQGDFLVNNNIGFQGTKQHQIITNGSGITSKEVEPLLQSSDPNFRPIDLKFGPDGALYVVDWYNPLISHGENPPRDPARDKLHGRIWRITYKSRPLLARTDISKQSIPQLLDNLKAPEDRFRYHSRAQIREKAPKQVLPELQKWIESLDKNDPQFEHYLLEALWLYQDFDVVEPNVLNTLLNAKEPQARASATKILRYWNDRIPNALELMSKRINDESPRVRLEAIVALSHLQGKKVVTIAVDVLKYPTDYYLDYAINETFNYLKPIWLTEFKQNENFLTDNPVAASSLLSHANENELMQLPQNKTVLNAILGHHEIRKEVKEQAVLTLAKQTNKKPVEIILDILQSHNKTHQSFQEFKMSEKDLIEILLARDKSELLASKAELIILKEGNGNNNLSAVGYAALIMAEGSDGLVKNTADNNARDPDNYFYGISLIHSPESVRIITDLIRPQGNYVDLATGIISSQTDPELKEFYAQTAVDRILDYMNETPENQQQTKQFNNILTLGKRLAALLPDDKSEKALLVLNNAGTMEIKLSTLPAKMLFDKENIVVTVGRSISLLFENPDLMPHNVVIVKPGTAEKVGEAADAMAKLKNGFEKNFIPDLPEVLFATPLVNAGTSFRLDFKAPEQPGNYPFICSFPGHWRVMKGILKVVKSSEQIPESSK